MHGFKVAKVSTRLVAAVALMTLSAACAADTGGSSDAKSNVLGDTIKVGGLVTKTSPIGYTSADAEVGAKARFERANEEGGVNGRKIDFIGAEDDGMAAATTDAAVKKLVQKDKVFSIVPSIGFGAGAAGVSAAADVTQFGWAISPNWCTSDVSFGVTGCMQPQPTTDPDALWSRGATAHLLANALGGSDGMAKAGTTVWVQGFDNTESKAGVAQSSQIFTDSGFKAVGNSTAIPATAPPQDWLPYINKVMKSNNGGPPDLIFSVMSGATNLGFYGALRQAGYKGAIADSTSYDPNLVADPQGAQVLEGVYTVTQFAPFEESIPAVQQMMDDVRKVDPGNAFTQSTALGYWSADMFLTALEKAGKDVTPDSFIAAASKMTYDSPGLGKLTFPLNRTEPTACSALVQVHSAKYLVAEPLECFSK